MLDIVSEVLPIGNNEWCVVVQRYNTSAEVRGRMSRDIDSEREI